MYEQMLKNDPVAETKLSTIELRNRMTGLIIEIYRKTELHKRCHKMKAELRSIIIGLYQDLRPKIMKYSERNKGTYDVFLDEMDEHFFKRAKMTLDDAIDHSGTLNEIMEHLGITSIEDVAAERVKYGR
jgi:hypothetical protein